jgi:serine/threonine protein kinase/WD40 repeat protein
MSEKQKPIPAGRGRLASPAEAMRASVERELGEDGPFQLESIPPAVPDHELLHRIGRGAYGEVWLARNALGTLRAVKIIYRGSFDDERPYLREFHGILRYEPISRSHPALVAVLHVGRNDAAGCFYYVMELADNGNKTPVVGRSGAEASAGGAPELRNYRASYVPRTLRSDLCTRHRLSPLETAQLGMRLAGGIAHLHAQGLVHRDIKPSNVIFVGGQPKLADIGLVTSSGDSFSFVGTEGFVPPEGPGTPQADLYALGKLLYEAVTGQDRLDFPQLPPGLSNSAEAEGILELNEVITRACLPSPNERYAGASEMEADLNLLVAGRSLRAAHRTEHHLRWFKRLAAATCLCLMLAAVGLWAVRNQARQARRSELEAVARAARETDLRSRAEAAEGQAKRQLWTALLEQARATVRSGELGQRVGALDALRRAAAISQDASLRREALAALSLPDLRFLGELPAFAEASMNELDPTFEKLAVSRDGGPVEILTVTNQEVVASLPGPVSNSPAYSGHWSRDGRFLSFKRDRESSEEHSDMEVWDTAANRRVLFVPDVPYGAMCYHPSLPQLIGSAGPDSVAIWDLKTGKKLKDFKAGGEPEFVVFSPQADRFCVCVKAADEWILSVRNCSDGAVTFSKSFPERVGCVDWDSKDRYLGVADHSGAVRLLDARSGAASELGRHKAQAVFTMFSRDGRYLLSGGWEREMICWDVQAKRRAFDINVDAFIAQFAADGTHFATHSLSGLRIYEFEEPVASHDLDEDLGGRINHAAFSPDARWLAAAGQARAGVWDLTTGGPAALAPEGADGRIFFSPDGGRVLVSRDDGFCAWNLSAGRTALGSAELERAALFQNGSFCSFCLASNQTVLTCDKGSAILAPKSFDLSEAEWKPTTNGVSSASEDGRWLAIFRPYSNRLQIYELPGFQPVAVLTNQAQVWHADFLPNGHELVVSTRRGIEIWSTQTWERTRRIPDFIGLLPGPDMNTLWLTRDYRTAGLYDAKTLNVILPLPAGLLPLALSSDGRQLAVSVDARRVQVWDIQEARKELHEIGLDWD